MVLRTLRKPTRWTPEEWARVVELASARGVAPLRYVREAALAAPSLPRPRRRARDELVHQLGRVLNNLRQLQRVAEYDEQEHAAARIEVTAGRIETAIVGAPAPGRTPASAVHVIVVAGRALNEVAHRANSKEELPPEAEVVRALEAVETALSWVFRMLWAEGAR